MDKLNIAAVYHTITKGNNWKINGLNTEVITYILNYRLQSPMFNVGGGLAKLLLTIGHGLVITHKQRMRLFINLKPQLRRDDYNRHEYLVWMGKLNLVAVHRTTSMEIAEGPTVQMVMLLHTHITMRCINTSIPWLRRSLVSQNRRGIRAWNE